MTKLMGLIAGSMSSSSGGLVTILETIASFYLGIVETIYTFFVQLVWLIMQFLLLVIDFIFVFVRHITGINVDFSDIGSLEESDILFQFMFSDAVMDVLKAIIVMAIVMIILFAIIGILKNEYLAATTNANNSKKQIMVSALKSVFMIILIPVIMIGSVFLSNAVLSALYNVTSGGNNISMGTEVFLSSTYQANVYRDYATSGKRIPITYDFSEDKVEDNIGSWADGDTIAETEEAYLAFRNQSVWQRGLSTYSVFLNGLFEDMDYIEEADKQAIAGGEPDGSAFHLSYDAGIFYKRDEYYQMGEAIDHAMRYGKELFFKTPQEITESWSGCLVDQKYRSLFTNNSDSISFSIKYTKDARATVYNAMDNGTIQDEAKGSVFLVCVRATDGENDYFAPLLANTDFYSSITEGENVVIAKGVFDEGKYPTAIRSTAGVVECYRDKVNAPYFADLFPKISYELPEGVTQDPVSKILKNGLSYIAGVDDIDKYIPYVYYNFDLWNLFGKTNRTVSSIDDGGFVLNYAFNDDDVRYDHFFSFTKTNIIVLVFCGIIIFGMLIKSVFGVTARVFDLVLLWIAYPAVCATMSLDGGGRFKGWTKTFTSKLFSVYSLVLGINLVLLLFPIIERIEIFSAADIQQYIADGLFAGWTADFVNFILRWFMVFVSFASVEIFMNIIAQLLGFSVDTTYFADAKSKKKKKTTSDYDLAKRGEEVLDGAKEFGMAAYKLVSGKFIVEGVKEIGKDIAGMVPGSAAIHQALANREFAKADKNAKGEIKKFEDAIRSGDSGRMSSQAGNVDKSLKGMEKTLKDEKDGKPIPMKNLFKK